jgi:hypothetical protein
MLGRTHFSYKVNWKGLIKFLISLIAVCWTAGCSNIRITDPPRTATEQYLLSLAAIKAVEPYSFDTLYGRRVYLSETYFAPAEKQFILGEFRAKLLLSGVQLVTDPEKAEIVMEVRSGGVGIDRYESLVGVPPLLAPAGAAVGASSATLITPELAATKNIKQIGFASIAYVAYWRDTGEIVANSDPIIGRTYREDWWMFGVGPHTTGNIPMVDHTNEE